MGQAKEKKKDMEALELVRDYAVMETKLDIVTLIKDSTDYEDAYNKVMKYCMPPENEGQENESK